MSQRLFCNSFCKKLQVLSVFFAKFALNKQKIVMNMLKQQNPQAFQQVQGMMQSGQDPNKILSQMMDQLSPQQKQQIQAMAQQFGIK